MKNHQCGMHCSCWYTLGALLWLGSLFALVCAWFASAAGSVFGFDTSIWYVNALALGILAIPLKLKKHAAGCECAVCAKP